MIDTIQPPAPPAARRKPARRRHGVRPGTKAVHYPGLASLKPGEAVLARAIADGMNRCNVRMVCTAK